MVLAMPGWERLGACGCPCTPGFLTHVALPHELPLRRSSNFLRTLPHALLGLRWPAAAKHWQAAGGRDDQHTVPLEGKARRTLQHACMPAGNHARADPNAAGQLTLRRRLLKPETERWHTKAAYSLQQQPGPGGTGGGVMGSQSWDVEGAMAGQRKSGPACCPSAAGAAAQPALCYG